MNLILGILVFLAAVSITACFAMGIVIFTLTSESIREESTLFEKHPLFKAHTGQFRAKKVWSMARYHFRSIVSYLPFKSLKHKK